eukprot:TRINITY_DN16440_c0_g1_i1.p1 TRINITY_DN16440_c0_g1~~TRINITY_DN16440_c0_g1_i1.p1  ORF type:complete len:158 (+),score=52.23 TRINITY_DN16440_c0_g1_i1:61-534(+)
MKSLFVVLLMLCAFELYHCHMYVYGSRSVYPNDPNFFQQDAQFPCAGSVTEYGYVNVTKNTIMPVTWTLWVNHNEPSGQPNGFVDFNWAAGDVDQNTKFTKIIPSVDIQDRPINYFTTSYIPVPDISGPSTIQLVYDVNGASSPFPYYYGCVDIWVS